MPLVVGGCAATTAASLPTTNPTSVALSTLEQEFNHLNMIGPVAESVWLMTDKPADTAFYADSTHHKHRYVDAFNLITEIKQNKEFQQQVAAILADPNAVAQLKSSDIPNANTDGTVSMDVVHQGAWAELHRLTPEQIQKHNQATLQNLADSMNNPKAFDGNPANAFHDKNGRLYADGTLVQTTLYNSNTKQTSPFFNDYNVRNVGTILDTKGNPGYWIVKVGTDKYAAFNFADMPAQINITAELTHTGSGTGGNATGNPFYIPYEVAKMFGNTDDTNVKGLALDVGFDPNDPQVSQFVKAMQGHGTSPNLMTDAQVKDLISGRSTLGSDGVAPAVLGIPDADDYLLNH